MLLKYYQTLTLPNEAKINPNFASQNGYQKLFSREGFSYDSPFNLDNIFFLSEHYPAHIQLPTKDISFYDFHVYKNSKSLDDFMRAVEINSTFGFFVSPKAKNFLEEFFLPNHQYYPVNIIHQNESHLYYFLLLVKCFSFINYKKSIFISSYEKNQELIVHSSEDLFELDERDNKCFPEVVPTVNTKKGLNEKKIALLKELDIYKEIFGIDFYFSEKLKQRIEQEGLTGLEFKEQDDIEFYLDESLNTEKIEEKMKQTITTLVSEPLKLLTPSSPYKLPPEITQIEVSEEMKDKGQMVVATLFSYYLENEQQTLYKVENIKLQLTSINKSKKLYTFENTEPFMVIHNEKAQHFPKNMKIIIEQSKVKLI